MKQLPMGEAEYRGLSHITRQLRFLRLLKGAQFERLLARIELYSFDSGETIFHKGDSPTAFYVIWDGKVRIHLGYKFLGIVKKVVHLGPGDLFGEMAIVEKRLRNATAVAEEPTRLFVLSYVQFDEMMKSDADFAELIQFVITRRKKETR